MWVRTAATPAALPGDAMALLDAADTLFSRRAWWETVLAEAMPPGATACFVAVGQGERTLAVFPMRAPAAEGPVLDSLTTPYTYHYAPIMADGLDPACQAAVCAAFARFCRRWAAARLDALAADWPGTAPLLAGARQAGLRVLRFDHFGNWHEPVAGLDWSTYLARRPGALRETIRRRLRRAERMPEGRFAVLTRPEAMAAGVAAFESVYARSWKEPEPFPGFNAALIHATARSGLLRLGVWSVADQPVAVQVWVVEHGRATVLKLAHDETAKAHSPGTVLTALMLRRLLDQERVTEIDFGRGDDAYKQGWARARRQRVGLMLVNPWRVAGLALLGRHALGRLRAALRPRGT